MSIGFALKIGVMWFLLIPLLTLNANAEPTHVLGRPEAKAETPPIPGVRAVSLVLSQFALCKAKAVSGDPKFRPFSSQEENPKKGTIDLNEVAELVGEAVREAGVVKDGKWFNVLIDKTIQDEFKEAVRRNRANWELQNEKKKIWDQSRTEALRYLPTTSTRDASITNLRVSLDESLRKIKGVTKRWLDAEGRLREAQDRVRTHQKFIDSLESKGDKAPTDAERKEITTRQDEIDRLVEEIDNTLFPAVGLINNALYLPSNFQDLLNAVTPDVRSEIMSWQQKNQPALDTMWKGNEAYRQYRQADIDRHSSFNDNGDILTQHLFFREALHLIIQTKNLRPVVVFDARGTLVHSGFYEFEVKDSARELPPVITLQLPENFNSSRFERQIQRLLSESVQATPTFRRFLSCPSDIFLTYTLDWIHGDIQNSISRSYRAPNE